ncbi:AAA family ATPase, partial [Nocardia sp. NPDC060220]|uniref:nSTAND1 domain-containing NTPase n=1 Tax=Nocardia sp. NPDC060220 TaxID=3347076 RepID=UPI00365C7DE2
MTAVTRAGQLDSENPWPGLESFEENGQAFFFGRDREAESLLNHVRDAPVTILYGRSGLGKTSLLRAGLFPALRNEHFLPIYIRLDLTPNATALSRQLHRSVRDSIRAEAPDAILPGDDESLWEYLHRKDFELWSAQNYPLTPVIVLDQFEELFTLGERVPDLVREFMHDLGDLAENRISDDVAARIDNDEAEAGRFRLRSQDFKLLITLREDFLPNLEEWCPLIP